ncbi:cbb3-type cytochrome oxidase assembly protein CcoS [Phenylobacterium sp.]|uniref:cbb3-type cytochrome oxidase assembly protein CcoS n=1 Tax=Phenylobacterium sp. TaxID=1871053 RepID=UPI0035B142F3
MSIVLFLAPISLFIAVVGLGAFWWTLKSGQYDDPAGDAARILIDDPEDRPL